MKTLLTGAPCSAPKPPPCSEPLWEALRGMSPPAGAAAAVPAGAAAGGAAAAGAGAGTAGAAAGSAGPRKAAAAPEAGCLVGLLGMEEDLPCLRRSA